MTALSRPVAPATFGERMADQFAARIGSWRFLVVQNILFVIWMALNVVAIIGSWDPYPFILLNLVLSFQAAETGPILLISANRAAQRDRDDLHRLMAEFSRMAEDHQAMHGEHRQLHQNVRKLEKEIRALLSQLRRTQAAVPQPRRTKPRSRKR